MLSRWTMIQWALTATVLVSLFAGCSDGDEQTRECTTRADCADGERCNDDGKCTTEPLACSASTDCDFGDYCVDNKCADATCTADAECTDAVCVNDLCRAGCVDDTSCGDGQTCNPVTRICAAAGCTTATCAQFQSCEPQTDGPSKCEYNGDCNNDAVCAAYGQQINDGNEYICSIAEEKCVIRPECGSDNDCVIGEICEPRASDDRKVCRRGCRETNDCGSGQVCNIEQGNICVNGCDTDDDCSGDNEVCSNLVCIESCTQRSDCTDINLGYVCTGNPRVCQGCTDSSQCPSTQFCDFAQGNSPEEIANPSVGLCVDLPPTCPDDMYGDNTSIDAAYEVTSLPFEPTGDDQPYYCRESSGGDWFKINANIGDVITAELEYAFAGNLDLALRTPDGRELAVSDLPPAEDNGTELIRYGTELGGTFFVQVRGSIVDANSRYGLRLNIAPPAACTDDTFEPNDDELNPPVLPPAVDHTTLEVCGDDRDFYTLQASANQILRIRAAAPTRLGNIDLVLRDGDGVVIAQALTNQNVEEIVYTTEEAADLVLEVRVATGVGNVQYALEWTQFDNVCTDPFELNNSCGEASVVAAGTYMDLAVCADADYYAFDLLPLQTITVKAIYDPNTAAGDLDITLFGPNDCATFIKSESRETVPNSTAIAETITYQAPSGGRFNLLASLFAGINVPYALEVDIQDGPPCTDDTFEPNSDLASASLISAANAALGDDNIISGAKICDADADWYAIELAEGDVIRWDVKFLNTVGNLDAFLVGPNGNVIASSTTDNDLESVTYTTGIGEAGTYYLRVEGKYPARADYFVLTYLNNVGPVDPACPDNLENNDSVAEAVTLTSGNYGLLVCGAPVDDDWFAANLKAGERINIDLSFAQAQGNIDLILYDDSSTTSPVDESRTTTDNESVSFLSSRDQTVKWRVYTTTTRPTLPYSMNVDIVPAGTCVDDNYETNEDAGTAKQLTMPGLYSALTKCEDNVDWFKFDAVEARKYEVFLNFVHRAADLNVTVYNSVLEVVAEGNSTTDDETVAFTTAAAGIHFIKIESATRARLIYDLMLYADLNGDGDITDAGEGPEDRVCPDDYEQNDLRTTARPLAIGTASNLLLCWPGGLLNDPDYYSFYVPQGATLTVNVDFVHSDGDINARLYRGTNPSAVAEGVSTTDNEVLTATNTGDAETYILWVSGGTGTFTSRYSVRSSLAFSTTCPEDMLGSADLATAATATALGPEAYSDLTLCEGTEDWFRLPAGTTDVELNLEINPLLGAVDLELTDATGLVLATADVNGATSTLTAGSLDGAELYYVRVSATNDAFVRNGYDLWVALNNTAPAQPFCADPYERNDNTASAYGITDIANGMQFIDPIACGADEDWYSANVLANTDYVFHTFFDHVADASDLALEVRDASGMLLTNGSVNSATNDELLTFRPTAAGRVFLGVKNVATSTTETPYYMVAARKLAPCKEDAFEPNDVVGDVRTAPAFTNIPGAYALGSCGASAASPEVDHYSFEMPVTGNVTITVMYDSSVLTTFAGTVYFSFDNNGTRFNTDKALTGSPNRLTTTVSAIAGERIGLRIFNATTSTSAPYFVKIDVN